MREAGSLAASRANGFIITCPYNKIAPAIIFDTDGDVVWRSAAPAPTQCSRALMDWNGEYMWMMVGNPGDGGAMGDVRRVRMDGSGAEQIPGLSRAHHDFAVLPGGGAAFLLFQETGYRSYLVERSPEGTLTTLAKLDGTTYLSPATDKYHANALRYHARDDSYTVSDLYVGSIAKLNRQGKVQWQLGGCDPAASQCATADLGGNHGHDLLANGNVLSFSALNGNGAASTSPVYEQSFSQQGAQLTAKLAWSYVGQHTSLIFGDVQRLPSGNTLVTYSTEAVIQEISPAGELVQTLTVDLGQRVNSIGYASFRESLYGPPQ